MIYFITGGQRSGKSSFAQKLAKNLSDTPIYLATSRIWDKDFEERVQRHKDDRKEEWKNIEEEKFVSKHNFEGETVLMDCVTLWLTNFFSDLEYDIEKSLEAAKTEFDLLIQQNFNLIIVSNEIGMGLHADSSGGRKFTDLQGWMNQYIAQKADEAYFMVSGLPMKLK